MSKRPLAPKFINKLDDYLLKNRPDTWSTRIHLLIYYWFLFSIGLSIICFFIPDNPLRESHVAFWIMSQSVLVIVAIVIWIVYLVRFNTFKSFGGVYKGDRIKTYLFYFLSLVLMCFTVWVPPVIETYKTMIRYSPSQVAEDMNNMNVLLARMIKDEANAEITVDSIFIIDYTTYVPVNPSGAYNWDDSLGAYVKTPIYMSRDELKYTLSKDDSVIWITNDKLLRFQVTNLRFISNYEIEEDAGVHVLTNFEIYDRSYKNGQTEDLQKLQREYFDIAEKYRDPENEWNDYWNYSTDPVSVAASKYKTSQVSAGISNICARLYRWEKDELIGAFHAIYYISMFIGLCLFIFRHSTLRTFFLSILTGVLIAILTGIFVAFLDVRETGLTVLALVYFMFFMVFSISTVHFRVRSVFTGIALNLAVVCTPFIPLLCTLLYYNFHVFDYSYYDYGMYDDAEWQRQREWQTMMYYLSEVIGFVILVVLIETLYKWMYRKWYAAPEE